MELNDDTVALLARYAVAATVPIYLVAGLLFLAVRDWSRGLAFICWGTANAALISH